MLILVEEYDKPILDALPDVEIAKQMREGLRNLYSVVKGHELLGSRNVYTLTYPNLEVKSALNNYILETYSPEPALKERNQEVIYNHFETIPHDWYKSNDIGRYEGYYASVFYSYLASIGIDFSKK